MATACIPSFWVVWNPRAGSPSVRHDTEMAARDEAMRLARLNPGTEFIVLEAIGAATKVDAIYTPATNQVPF